MCNLLREKCSPYRISSASLSWNELDIVHLCSQSGIGRSGISHSYILPRHSIFIPVWYHFRTVSVSISYLSSSTKNGASSPHSHPCLGLARAIECLLACLRAIFAPFHNQAPMQKEAYVTLLRSSSHGGTVIGVWKLAAEYITGKLETILLFSRLNAAIAAIARRMQRAACSNTKV